MKETLQKKVAGIPLWAWGLVVLLAAYVLIRYRKSKAAGEPLGQPANQLDPNNPMTLPFDATGSYPPGTLGAYPSSPVNVIVNAAPPAGGDPLRLPVLGRAFPGAPAGVRTWSTRRLTADQLPRWYDPAALEPTATTRRRLTAAAPPPTWIMTRRPPTLAGPGRLPTRTVPFV